MSKLAINGAAPVRTAPFPPWPVHDDRERKAVLEVLESGKWWYGEKVRQFEERFARFQDARFGITTVNGTAALEIALACAGVGAGDEVIVPPYTFISTASAVLKVNAIPVFCDVERETFNMDADKIEGCITASTKAIIPVHFAGLPCDMDRILDIARRHNLIVIEDACHSWGTKWKGKGAGALGTAGAFSFQMSKNITSGEGGIILTDDEELAERCRSYANCGRAANKPWYEHYMVAGNYRMTEFQAAILLAQLQRLQSQVERRAENAWFLNERLGAIEGIKTVREDARAEPRSYHLYCFRFDSAGFGGLGRERFVEAMAAEGIPCSTGYPHPLYKNPLFARSGAGAEFCPLSCPFYGKKVDYSEVECPECERLCQEALWFSQSMLLGSRRDMEDIVRAVTKIRENVGELV